MPMSMSCVTIPRCGQESKATAAERVTQLIEERGWGFWAVEERRSGQFIGFVGLHVPSALLPFSPCVEVGWRLTRSYWGLGYATEAAQSAIAFGFQHLQMEELVAFTAIANLKSRAVMERLGMRPDGEFDHPPGASRIRIAAPCVISLE